ncbi:MAG: Endonuclease III (EC [uncultured Thiotrichaceae bacterium]|uniref:Endonuclease III (EC) n=1 Tax=uncultured Thiotrichaceae bacterium TaxID=298394 RepID=A0A6S6S4J5_9GAMM|nr:MAG: Endonuclease III (EC [uncultured Thiotrichaceae bacterium]
MIEKVFSNLHKYYGDQNWWPANSEFEIMVGAILAQNSKWESVEKAIMTLKENDALSPEIIANTSANQLATWAHTLDDKAANLKTFCQWYLEQGALSGLKERDTDELREELLQIDGIDEEIADSILLYALERPVFVIDDNLRRLFFRLGMINGNERYDELKHVTELTLQWDVEIFNEYHALIVKHTKEHCRTNPICEGCPLDHLCPNEKNDS